MSISVSHRRTCTTSIRIVPFRSVANLITNFKVHDTPPLTLLFSSRQRSTGLVRSSCTGCTTCCLRLQLDDLEQSRIENNPKFQRLFQKVLTSSLYQLVVEVDESKGCHLQILHMMTDKMLHVPIEARTAFMLASFR